MTTKATKHLRNEHNHIRSLLSAFRRYLEQFESGSVLDSREAKGFIDFLGENLFLKHEEKEEGILLPELARMGLSWNDGSLAHVRKEHRHGRYFFRSLRHSMLQLETWSNYDRVRFLSMAHGWIDFVEAHMSREERILFPYVDSNLPDDVDALVTQKFETTDREYAEMPDHSDLLAQCEQFERRYGKVAGPRSAPSVPLQMLFAKGPDPQPSHQAYRRIEG